MSSYKTIKAPAFGEITEKKSRFIASLYPAATPEEARERVEAVKKQYHDARHNCYAYILGDDSENVKYSDDGEPQGTAGRPMLEVLKGRGLTYVTAVVTRYFGGILLGTGGLQRAYSDALAAALDNACTVTMQLMASYAVTVDYTLTGRLENHFEKNRVSVADTLYTDKVTYILALPPAMADTTLAALTELTAGKAVIEKKGEAFGAAD